MMFRRQRVGLRLVGMAHNQSWKPRGGITASGSLGAMLLVSFACARDKSQRGAGGWGGSSGGGKDGDDDDAVAKIIDAHGDKIGKVGIGGLLGICSGYAFKKVGKAAAFMIGVGFIGLQVASHYGYINIDWGDAEKKTRYLLDQDGDGDFDKDDVKLLWNKFKKLVTHGLPSGSGFASGFAAGLYYG